MSFLESVSVREAGRPLENIERPGVQSYPCTHPHRGLNKSPNLFHCVSPLDNEGPELHDLKAPSGFEPSGLINLRTRRSSEALHPEPPSPSNASLLTSVLTNSSLLLGRPRMTLSVPHEVACPLWDTGWQEAPHLCGLSSAILIPTPRPDCPTTSPNRGRPRPHDT